MLIRIEIMNDVTSAKILFVEDEEAVLSSMKKFFDKQGFFTLGARSSEEALTLATRHKPDIAILDVMLHEGPEGQKDDPKSQKSGFDICKSLRDNGFSQPIIFLTACTTEQEKLLGFEVGADDYVTKPFSLPVLLARVRANLKRVGNIRKLYTYGNVVVDLEVHEIRHTVGDTVEKEALSRRECDLISYLIQNRGRIISREKLLEKVWDYNAGVHTRTVDTHILTVRKKLRDDAIKPMFIQTHHGVGYQFIGTEF